jgi:CDP-diacylglycerol--glycerol-3-phosphate 3-phosphatidyltransferase
VPRTLSKQARARVLTVANAISLLRLLCIPVFIGLIVQHRLIWVQTPGAPHLWWYRWAALAVFLLAAVSDAADGYIARRWAQHTVLGAWLDPLADKLLLSSAILALALPAGLPTRLPFWFPIVTISRDALLLLGSLIVFMARGNVRVQPTLVGKLTTCAQMACVVLTLLSQPDRLVWWCALAASLLTAVSLAQYVAHGQQQVWQV